MNNYLLRSFLKRILGHENNASDEEGMEVVYGQGPIRLLEAGTYWQYRYGEPNDHATLFIGDLLIRLGRLDEAPRWYVKYLQIKRKLRKVTHYYWLMLTQWAQGKTPKGFKPFEFVSALWKAV